MSSSQTLQAQKREKLGSRPSRRLRAEGRIPATIQPDGDKAHLDIHIEEIAFLTARRNHVHLFDIDVEGTMETALVRELQWDAFGDNIIHVEFRRVVRGVKTESEVEIAFSGHPKGGVVNHIHDHVTILSLPSQIPDSVEVKLAPFDEGDSIHASDIVLPEGVELAVEPGFLIATLSGAGSAEPAEEGEGEGDEGLGGVEPAAPSADPES